MIVLNIWKELRHREVKKFVQGRRADKRLKLDLNHLFGIQHLNKSRVTV